MRRGDRPDVPPGLPRVRYEGSYRDYSVHGWPKKYYRGRTPIEEEIAVAAYYLWKKANEAHGHDVEQWFAGEDQLEAGLARAGVPGPGLQARLVRPAVTR